ncbi:MAG TPA: hypothetical protein PLM22_03090 [Candidatus Sabulitectum sp.]|nr:hypothetical protein [Candidatus Sabulitectum sp.]HPJ27891.1 hypothetical protein [Candidatus Sabulitectum sp.]HPR21880.1 hypothetical protein [Candidatus Sabulitectum sp.]
MLALMIILSSLQVHEWGVIVQNPLYLTGEAAGEVPVNGPEPELEDRAPVIYFHGDPCAVDIRVAFPAMGYATSVIPQPSTGGEYSTYIEWNGVELVQDVPEDMSSGWDRCAVNGPWELWRQVDCLSAVFQGHADRFLYYECVPGSPGELPFISQGGNRSFREEYRDLPCVVLASSSGGPMYGVFTLGEISSSIPKGLRFLDDPAILRREIRLWAEGTLHEDEFDAFWSTWESRFLEDSSSDVMVLYQVPAEVLERIADLEVTARDGSEVQLSRFIVAELPYRTP